MRPSFCPPALAATPAPALAKLPGAPEVNGSFEEVRWVGWWLMFYCFTFLFAVRLFDAVRCPPHSLVFGALPGCSFWLVS